jgi:YD repeat-containing protein
MPIITARSLGYDASCNQVRVTEALNHGTSRTFDAAGQVLTETDPDGRTTSHTYDGCVGAGAEHDRR